MWRMVSAAMIVGLMAGAGMTLAQENPSSTKMIPAIAEPEINCTGFIASREIQAGLQVFEGADNDLSGASHIYTEGQFLYLKGKLDGMQVGSEYRLIRVDSQSRVHEVWNGGELGEQLRPPQLWFSSQHRELRRAGEPYTDVGKVRVTNLTPAGAVAQILFTCEGVAAGDLAVPYRPREIPSYNPALTFDRFAPSTGKLRGAIIATQMAQPHLGDGNIAFLNLGSNAGVRPGQRYLIYHLLRDKPVFGSTPETPRENIGEMVIITVEEKSAVAKVISNIREVSVGDGAELE